MEKITVVKMATAYDGLLWQSAWNCVESVPGSPGEYVEHARMCVDNILQRSTERDGTMPVSQGVRAGLSTLEQAIQSGASFRRYWCDMPKVWTVACASTDAFLLSSRLFSDAVPRASSGVVRIDPLHFLARCCTRQLNQTLSILYLSIFYCVVVY